jgi:hypothetical protein
LPPQFRTMTSSWSTTRARSNRRPRIGRRNASEEVGVRFLACLLLRHCVRTWAPRWESPFPPVWKLLGRRR